jgi:cold shock protein
MARWTPHCRRFAEQGFCRADISQAGVLLQAGVLWDRRFFWGGVPHNGEDRPGRRAVGARRCATTGQEFFPMAMTGTIKFFNGERGYGFIKPDDGGRDVFVHITAVEHAGLKALNEGQRITFDVEPDKKGKGPKAVNLVLSS